MNKYLIFFFFISGCYGCSIIPDDVKTVLDLAGENKQELQAVLDHYQDPEDKLKLQAAYFLIGNMRNQYHYSYSASQELFIDLIYSDIYPSKFEPYQMKKWFSDHYKTEELWRPILEDKWDSIKNIYSRGQNELIRDFNIIDHKLLINNIDLAFASWQKSPWYKQVGFQKFCETILPYRSRYEIPVNDRDKLIKASETFNKPTILESANVLADSMELYFLYCSAFEEFHSMKTEDVIKTRSIVCRQHTSVKLAFLRAMGIPSYEVFAPGGTSWVGIETEAGDVYDWEWKFITDKRVHGTISEQRGESYAKVYKVTYDTAPPIFKDLSNQDIPLLFQQTNISDASNDFLVTSDVEIEIKVQPPDPTDYVFLCHFDAKTRDWKAIDWGEISGDKVKYKNIGRGKIYYPAYFLNKQYYPAGHTFYLTDKGKKIILNPGVGKEVLLRRKCDWNFIERFNAFLTVGTWFEGANNPFFLNPTVLAIIKDQANHYQEIQVSGKNSYRYFRYVTLDTTQSEVIDRPTGMHLAEIAFIDGDGNEISGKPMSINPEKTLLAKNLFDGDIRTNFDINDKPGWVGLDPGKAIEVSKVKYLIRNSFNTIEPGDRYELLYWDNTWKSQGTQIAKYDYLKYSAPENAVLWLRNLTKGKNEMIFFMKEGKQVWG